MVPPVFLLLTALPLADILPPVLAGLERTSARVSAPSDYLRNQWRDVSHARTYVTCGLQSVLEADYGGEKITVFEMESPLAALCAFGNDKTLDGNPLEGFSGPQSEAYRAPGALFLRQGRYYALIRGGNGRTGSGSKGQALLKAIAFSIPSPQTSDPQIEALRQLPVSGRIPGSDRYLTTNVFGWSELTRGYSIDYGCADIGVSIANIALPSGVSAAAVYKRVVAEAKNNDYTLTPWGPGDESVRGVPNGSGNVVYFIRVGEYLAAIDADQEIPGECRFLGDQLEQSMRSRSRRLSVLNRAPANNY